MPPVKTLYVPRFGSQQGSSQKSEPDQIEPLSQSLRDKSGNKRRKDRGEKPRSTLKVKILKLTSRSLIGKVTKDDKTPARWMLEPAVNNTKTAVNRGGRQCNTLGANAAVADGDVFFFSQQSSGKATNEKEKAKLSVLRTISKMLEENQLIRQRLDALSKAK